MTAMAIHTYLPHVGGTDDPLIVGRGPATTWLMWHLGNADFSRSRERGRICGGGTFDDRLHVRPFKERLQLRLERLEKKKDLFQASSPEILCQLASGAETPDLLAADSQ